MSSKRQTPQYRSEPRVRRPQSRKKKVHAGHDAGDLPPTRSPLKNNAASPHTVNVVFPEKSHAAQPSAPKPGAKDDAVSKDHGQNRSSVKNNNNHPNAEISAIPDPVPNTVAPAAPSSTPIHTSSLLEAHSTSTSNAPSAMFTVSSSVAAPSVSLLSAPPTAAPALSSVSSLPPAMPPSISAERPVVTSSSSSSRQTNNSRQLPIAAVVLLVLGGIFFMAAILVGIKLYLRPRRRSHPTPSLPILQDTFPPPKMGDESPLFGGKERFSSQAGNDTVPWTWTQYQSGIPTPTPSSNLLKPIGASQSQRRYSRLPDEMPSVPRAGEAAMQEATPKQFANPPAVVLPNKALSRLSSMSGLVYPASMHEAGQEGIGIAVSSGQAELSHTGSVRGQNKRVSVRESMRNFDKRRSTIYGSPEGLAYTMLSPVAPDADGGESGGLQRGGRAAVKAPYGAGSYFRASTSTGTGKHLTMSTDANPFGDASIYAVPPVPSLEGNHTKAHAPNTPGLMTPDPVSPGLSLYPDDSLSVAGGRKWTAPKASKGRASPEEEQTGGEQGDAAMDRMAVSERRLSRGLTSRASVLPSARGQGDQEDMDKLRRADDKPPRVPSPPVLPSLAQMAMAHTGGQDFADYRSPTYSIYGLYSSERKSRAEG
ncbi:hypothetical protein BC834DRAFT_855238 [Gloeopeniophorella convolvens]|nr:hypothetical protein BC834DRAFT_855238 [Gloeopeniophorella convolvens]